MKCDLCGSDENVFFIQNDKGNFRICMACAKNKGLNLGDVLTDPDVNNLSFSNTNESKEKLVCPMCGTTEDSIISNGKLACSNCANVFKSIILSVLRKNGHFGSYEGKVPHFFLSNDSRKTSIVSDDGEESLSELYVLLENAVNGEDFEEAAIFRDRIKEISKKKMTGSANK